MNGVAATFRLDDPAQLGMFGMRTRAWTLPQCFANFR